MSKIDTEMERLIFDSVNKMIDDNYKLIHEDLINKIVRLSNKLSFICSVECKLQNLLDYSLKEKRNKCSKCIKYRFNEEELLKKLLNYKIIDIKYEINENTKMISVNNQMNEHISRIIIINYYDIFGYLYKNNFEINLENSNLEPIIKENNEYYDNNLFTKPFENKIKLQHDIDYFNIIIKYGAKEDIIKIYELKEKEKLETERKIKEENLEVERKLKETINRQLLEEKEIKRKDEEFRIALQQHDRFNQKCREIEINQLIHKEQYIEEIIRKEEADRRCQRAGYKNEEDWHNRFAGKGRWAEIKPRKTKR
jgi:hypothetical protein